MLILRSAWLAWLYITGAWSTQLLISSTNDRRKTRLIWWLNYHPAWRISISTAWLQLLLWLQLQLQHQHQLQLQWHFCFWASWCLRCLTEELYAGLPVAVHYSKGSRIHMKVAYGSPPILRDSLWIKAHFKYCFISIIDLSDMIILRHAREYERASFIEWIEESHFVVWALRFQFRWTSLGSMVLLM